MQRLAGSLSGVSFRFPAVALTLMEHLAGERAFARVQWLHKPVAHS
ncbi:MAG: hypothetical protein ACMV16_10505 [Macromonas sp.]